MRDYPNRFLDNSYAEDINVYGIEGISQYLVITANSEYSFTRIEDARGFAAQLAAKREMLKTASLDRPAAANIPPGVNTQKHPKRFL